MTGTQATTETAITLAKAAKLMGVSPRSVARYAFDKGRRHRLETFRIGGSVRTTVEAVARFIDGGAVVQVEPVAPSRAARAVADALALCRGRG